MPGRAACTIAAKNHLAFARVVAQSFRTVHPDVPFFTLVADEIDGYIEPDAEPFTIVRLADLEIPALERFRFHYPQQPLSYAATPYLLAHLLDRGFDRVIFFKQESLILGDHTPVFDLLGHHTAVVTPHLLAPLDGTDRVARELNILLSGTFNIGMLGVSRCDEARRLLAWWQDRVYTHCRHAVDQGMHYEQRWMDLAPVLFDGVHILRDTRFNVGHWNLPERAIDVRNGTVLVDGQPCRLFRFSGYDVDFPERPTRYNTRLDWNRLGPARDVFTRFAKALDAAGHGTTRHWPYAYGTFDNGVPVPDIARWHYFTLGDEALRFGDPLSTRSPESFFAWLNGPADEGLAGTPLVSRFWHAIYRQRPDLQQAFPDVFDAHRAAFDSWTRTSGIAEYRVDGRFLPGAVS